MRASISSPSFAAMALTHRNVATLPTVQHFTDLGAPTDEEMYMTFDEEAAVEIEHFESLKVCQFFFFFFFFFFFLFCFV